VQVKNRKKTSKLGTSIDPSTPVDALIEEAVINFAALLENMWALEVPCLTLTLNSGAYIFEALSTVSP
jgi:hypothetical protein